MRPVGATAGKGVPISLGTLRPIKKYEASVTLSRSVPSSTKGTIETESEASATKSARGDNIINKNG